MNFPKAHFFAVVGVTSVVATAFVFSPAGDAQANKPDSGLNTPITVAQPKPNLSFPSLKPSAPEMSANLALQAATSVSQTADALIEEEAAAELTGNPFPEDLESSVVAEAQPEEHSVEKWANFVIKSGDTLSHLFEQAGYDAKVMYQVLDGLDDRKALSRIFTGQTLSFIDNGEGIPAKIRLQKTELESLLIALNDSGSYESKEVVLVPDLKVAYASGVIDSSLYLSAKKAGIDEAMIMELADIFAWDIDFLLDIRSGDEFSLVYEEKYLDGKKIGNGHILAASFKNQGEQHQAVLHRSSDGYASYFAPDGSSMKGAFLRSPIEFARVSSHFSLGRMHPVLHKMRAHKGTDYAAGTGTPIRATGDGKVVLAGRKGGYGNTVVIQHGQKYSTLYAHLSKYGKGIRSGLRVRQGQTIGYVGSSGLATGPHLHYEFLVNGVQKNSVTVKLPKAESIPKSEMANFQAVSARYIALLENKGRSDQLAFNE